MASHTTNSNVFQSVVFLSLFSVGFAIHCFQCNTAEDPACFDLTVNDTHSPYYRKCDGDYQGQEPFCRKLATEVKDVDDSERVLRSCGWIRKANASQTKNPCRRGHTDFIKKTVCECFTDACNASDGIVPSFAIVVVVGGLFRYLGAI